MTVSRSTSAAAATSRVHHVHGLPQVHLTATDGRSTEPLSGGWAAKDLARAALTAAGFTAIGDDAKVVQGVQPTLSALDHKGRRWWFEVVGGRTSNRPGAQRAELLWRAIAKGAVVHAADPGARYGVLTTGLPAVASGGAALKAVTGPKQPVTVVVDLLADDAAAVLKAAGR